MSALAVSNLHQPNLQARVENPTSRPANEVEAFVGLEELQALRLNVDGLAPPEAATMAEPLVDQFRGEMTSGDHLRLPLATNHDARAVRGALMRMLTADTSVPFADRDAVSKEQRMLRVLKAYRAATGRIQERSSLASGY